MAQITGEKMTDNKKIKKLFSLQWAPFAFGEGLAKAINKSLHKFMGGYIKTLFATNKLTGTFFITFVIGCVQSFGGLIIAKFRSEKLYPSFRQIRGSIAFGAVASIMSFLSVFTFIYPGTDLAAVTFLITLSIIPSRLIDRVLYKKKLVTRQYIGLMLYLVVAYIFIKDFTDPSAFFSLPPWAWFSLAIGVLLSINNLITNELGKATSPYVHNFWIGLATLTISSFVITCFDGWEIVKIVKGKIWSLSMIMGTVTLFMIIMKVLAFRLKPSLTFEVFIQQSSYLVFVTLFGILFFQEQITIGKIIGIPGFFVAFILANQEMWDYCTDKLNSKRVK